MKTIFLPYRSNPFPQNINVEKIGNLIAYLANKIPDLYSTKVLKLLYLIDETSIKETGLPVTDLDYNVWKKGPVPAPVYYDLIHDNPILGEYISKQKVNINNKPGILITPKSNVSFDNSEFSEYDLELIDKIITLFSDLLSSLFMKLFKYWNKLIFKNFNVLDVFECATLLTIKGFLDNFILIVRHFFHDLR